MPVKLKKNYKEILTGMLAGIMLVMVLVFTAALMVTKTEQATNPSTARSSFASDLRDVVIIYTILSSD